MGVFSVIPNSTVQVVHQLVPSNSEVTHTCKSPEIMYRFQLICVDDFKNLYLLAFTVCTANIFSCFFFCELCTKLIFFFFHFCLSPIYIYHDSFVVTILSYIFKA